MLNMNCFKLIWFGTDFRGKLINYSVLKLEKLRNCTESELEIEQFIVGGNDIFKLLDSEKRYLSFWMKEKCKDCIPSLFSIFGHFFSSSFLRLLSLVIGRIGGISEVFLLISKYFGSFTFKYFCLYPNILESTVSFSCLRARHIFALLSFSDLKVAYFWCFFIYKI